MRRGRMWSGVLVFVSLLAAVPVAGPAAAGTTAGADPRVVGGQVVPSPRSWAVALAFAGDGSVQHRLVCSGTLVAPRWVLTAKHCVFGLPADPSQAEVVIGRRDLADESQGEVIRVADTRKHPDADIALLELAAPSTLAPLPLAGPDVASGWGEHSHALVYGYGMWEDDFISRFLRRARLRISEFTGDHLEVWAGNDDASPCFGDSGGPLVVATPDGARQVGVVSRDVAGEPCVGRAVFPLVGARGTAAESPLYRWVTDTIGG